MIDWGVLRWPTYITDKSNTSKLEAEISGLQEHLQAAKAELEANLHNQTQHGDYGSEGNGQGSGFAYVFYATTEQYACSVLVNVQRLKGLGSIYPVYVLLTPTTSERYKQALEAAGATIHIQEAPSLKDDFKPYYKDCMLKLLTFKMQKLEPHLTRVLALDSDQLVMRNLDPLFTCLPAVDLAAPRAYWIAKDFFASTFLMIDLCEPLWRTVKSALDDVGYNKFDMDLLNDLLGDTVMMLSGEYVTLIGHWEDWNLPNWYHPQLELNMTSIQEWNELAENGTSRPRSAEEGEGEATYAGDLPPSEASSHMVSDPPAPSNHRPDPGQVEHHQVTPSSEPSSPTPTSSLRFAEDHALTK